MKKTTFLKTFALIFGLLFQATIGWSQIMVENFDYTIGSLLTDNGWTAHSGGGTQPIDVTTGLNFEGYASSGIGGAANLDNNGEDDNKTFDAQTTGTVYAAFVIQTQSPNSAGYFLHFSQSPLNTSFYFTKVWVNANGDGIGLSGSSAPTSYTTITPGVPTLVVVKFDFTTKISSMYVFSTFPSTEPAVPNATYQETVTPPNVGCIALRQYNAGQRQIIDGIRIGANWADAATAAGGPPTVVTPTFSPTPGVTENPVDVTISCATPGAHIYYTTDGTDPDQTSTLFTIPFNVSQTTTVKARAYLDGYNPSSIAAGIYNFRTVVSTIAEIRAGTAGDPYLLTGEVFLTYQQAYRNQKFVQDYTGAMLIDDAGGKITSAYEIGDGFAGLKGSFSIYQGMLEFVPAFDPGDPTNFHLFTPETVTINDLNNNFETYESKLVKILNVTFADGGSLFNAVTPTVYAISDASDASGFFRTTFLDADYLGTTIPIVPTTIIGIFNQAGSPIGNYITSRTSVDIIPNSVTPTIIVTRPDGGEYWQQGTTEAITWNNLNFTGNVTIQLTKPPFTTIDVATNIANTGTWDWAIPSNQALSNQYKIRVKGVNPGDPSDESDNYFSIVTYVGLPRIVINEIMYNSIEAADNEWIELYNREEIPIDLEGYIIKDNLDTHILTIPAGYTIGAGDYFTVSISVGTPPLFFTPDFPASAGWGLNNSPNDQVRLYNPGGILVDSVQYSNTAPWPTGAAGNGPSLELIDPALDNTLPESWAASLAANGTPGEQNSVFGMQFLTVTSPNGGETFEQGTTQPITWTSANFTGFIKIELESPAKGLVTLAENVPVVDGTWDWAIPADQAVGSDYKIKISDQADGDPMDESDAVFSIISVIVPSIAVTSPNGGELWEQASMHPITWTAQNFTGNVKIELSDGAKVVTLLVDGIPVTTGTWDWNIPADQALGSTYTVIVSGMQAGEPTDASDAVFSIIPPAALPNVVITEIMYNPPESGTDSLEFIEIYNNDVISVNLQGWYFSLGVVYVFPNYTLAPGAYCVTAVKSSAMLNTFGVTALQWTSGGLSNSGEAIELRNAGGEIIDNVTYDDVAPWPASAAGYGPSLTLCDPSSDNSLAANWSASIEYAAVNTAGTNIYATPGQGCSGDLAQTFVIPSGWSGVSSYMIPTDPAVSSMFAPIQSAIVVLQDFSKLYLPDLGINTIGNWDIQTGYQTKLTVNKYFIVKGAYETNKTVSLTAGWNGLPVISTCPVSVATLFAGVPEVIFAKEMGSNLVYWPDGGLNTLTTLVPGRAYYVKVTTAIDLTFPECTAKGEFVSEKPENKIQSIWNDVTPTGASHAIGFDASALKMLKAGDVIGAFTANGYCAGITEVGEGNALIMAWADDVYTMEADGFVAQEPLSYKVYRPSTGEVFDVTAIYDNNTPDAGNFTTNGISFVKELKMGATGIAGVNANNVQVYPNPANSVVNINLSEHQFTNIEVYSMIGTLIATGNISGSQIKLDISAYNRGVYFLKLINLDTGDQITTRFIKE